MSDQRQTDVQPYSEAGQASVEGHHVLLDGPDGIAIALTPEAALEMGRSLVRAAEELLGEETHGS